MNSKCFYCFSEKVYSVTSDDSPGSTLHKMCCMRCHKYYMYCEPKQSKSFSQVKIPIVYKCDGCGTNYDSQQESVFCSQLHSQVTFVGFDSEDNVKPAADSMGYIPACECGSDFCNGGGTHSSWCPKFKP